MHREPHPLEEAAAMWLKGKDSSCCLPGPLLMDLGSQQQSRSMHWEVPAGLFSREQRTGQGLSFSCAPCRLGSLCC